MGSCREGQQAFVVSIWLVVLLTEQTLPSCLVITGDPLQLGQSRKASWKNWNPGVS